MAEEPGRSRLGRGLAALIGDVGDESEAALRARAGQRRAPIEFLRPNPKNPRRAFADADLDDLANSVRERGVLQPILVRGIAGLDDAFEIIAGERRWRAAQRAGLHDVPILVIEAGDRDAMEIAIIENVQRADLNAIEEASGYEQLISEHAYSQGDLAKAIGKSRSHIANTLRLKKLPTSVQDAVVSGALSAGHARALLAVGEPEKVAKQAIEQGLTVRDVERIAQRAEKAPERKGRARPPKDPDTIALERALEEVLGLSVAINHHGEGGEVRIRYRTLDQLDGLCRRLKR